MSLLAHVRYKMQAFQLLVTLRAISRRHKEPGNLEDDAPPINTRR
jgi:hypothetical protein